jgi:hypothetical protein
MSARSQYVAPNCSKARAKAKTIGRHARKLQRREKRTAAGDFTFQLLAIPLDVTLRRLYRPVIREHQTRNSARV